MLYGKGGVLARIFMRLGDTKRGVSMVVESDRYEERRKED